MNKNSKPISLLLAGVLQISPLIAKIFQSSPALARSPILAVMSWAFRAAVVAGAHHAVSAASAYLQSSTTVSGTQNSPLPTYGIVVYDPTISGTRTPNSWRINGTLYNYAASATTTNGMPTGCRLRLDTGLISGIPTVGGTNSQSITAYEDKNGGGHSLTFTLTFRIAAVTQATTITNNPVSTNLHVGEPLTLTVGASGTAPFSYQWQKDLVNIPGATSATYSVGSVVNTNAGSYTAIVTAAGGSKTSNPAVITVTPLSIQIQPHVASGPDLVLQTVSGRHYFIQATPSLNPMGWSNVAQINATSGTSTYTDTSGAGELYFRYYPSP